MAKKKSKTSIAKKACQVIQQYARLNETDQNGYGACVSCGTTVHYSDSDGGHFQPKGNSYNAACVNPKNVHLQCKRCNAFLGGNPAGYAEWMVAEYGPDILGELFLESKKTSERADMVAAVEKFRAKNKELAKTKMFPIKLY